MSDSEASRLRSSHKCIPTGSILPFAGEKEPDGWLMCYGQIVSRFQYKDLYDAIGKAYTLPAGPNQVPLSEDLFLCT